MLTTLGYNARTFFLSDKILSARLANERVPVYNQFPDTLPPIVVPEPVFVQSSSLSAVSLRAPEPIPTAQATWSGETAHLRIGKDLSTLDREVLRAMLGLHKEFTL